MSDNHIPEPRDWTNGVVAIVDAAGKPAGTGFVATRDGLIVTCAHVLDDAGWPYSQWNQPVSLRFHANFRPGRARVLERHFRDQTAEDIAVLQLEGDLPAEVEPLPLANARGSDDHAVKLLGYLEGHRRGLHGRADVFGPIDQNGFARMQLWSEQSTHGYSGGPLWDATWRRVIGIVKSGREADRAGRHAFTMFAVPTEALLDACDRLQPSPVTIVTDLAAALNQLADMPTDSVPDPAPLPTGSHMPLSANPLFVGREEELQQLATLLKGGGTAAIGQAAAATGMGGIGKTQLTSEFVHRYGQYFAGGVYWLSFATAEGVPAEIARAGEAMGLPGYDALDVPDQIARIRQAWQEPLPRLLIFDNCEEPELARAYRPTSGGCRVLITSRRSKWDKALGIQTVALRKLPRVASIRLLQKHVEDLPEAQADNIAAELGDLPLALHLAGAFLAAYSEVVSPNDYVKQLRDGELLRHPSLRGRPEVLSPTNHEHHVGRTFALSYERLVAEDSTDRIALDLLCRAAFFAAGEVIPGELLLATLGADSKNDGDELERQLTTADALRRLTALGLLETEGSGYRLHRLLKVFVLELAEEDDRTRAQAAVEEIVLEWASALNNAGLPGPLLQWQEHLRAVTDRAMERVDERTAGLANAMGSHLQAVGQFSAARSYYEHALAIRDQALGSDHPSTATSLNNLGHLLHAMGLLEAARPYYERALAVRKQVVGPNHPDTATTLNNLGGLLDSMGQLEAARSYYERALTINVQFLGPNHPDTALSFNNLGTLLVTMGQLEAARPYYERALAIFEKAFGPDHPDTALSLNNLGYLLRATGQLQDARPYYERALAIREQALGPNHPDTATSLNNMGALLRAMGQLEAAYPYYERALAIFEKALGPVHPNTARSLNNLGTLLHALGQLEAARPYHERAQAIFEKALGADHPDTALSLNNLGHLLQAMGQLEAARPYYERALSIFQEKLGDDHRYTRVVNENLQQLIAEIEDSVE